jgi:hypothetical protein
VDGNVTKYIVQLRHRGHLVGFVRTFLNGQDDAWWATLKDGDRIDRPRDEATLFVSAKEAEGIAECFRSKTSFNLGGWTGADVVEVPEDAVASAVRRVRRCFRCGAFSRFMDASRRPCCVACAPDPSAPGMGLR